MGSKACSADAPVAQSDADTCVKEKNDATCGAKYTALLECAGKNSKCGADNKSDSSAFASACATELSDYTKCKTPATTGDAGS
ncbi:MAG: hypothetical protein ABI461_08250 [Polyangiaceae bacterium]